MSLTNIQRDFRYLRLIESNLPFGTEWAINTETPTVNGSGDVFVDVGQLSMKSLVTQTAGHARSNGVMMTPPTADRVPYRVKASCKVPTDTSVTTHLLVGYGPASITGSDDNLTRPRWIPMVNGVFDDIILIDAIATSITEYGRPVFFGIATADSVLSADLVFGHISVQNLGVKHPTMQNACC